MTARRKERSTVILRGTCTTAPPPLLAFGPLKFIPRPAVPCFRARTRLLPGPEAARTRKRSGKRNLELNSKPDTVDGSETVPSRLRNETDRRDSSRIVLVRIKILPITCDIRASKKRCRLSGYSRKSLTQPLHAPRVSPLEVPPRRILPVARAPLHPNLWISLDPVVGRGRTNE